MINRFPVLALLLVVAMAALVTVFSKQTLTRVDAFTFTWLQVVSGVCFLFVFRALQRQLKFSYRLNKKSWGLVLAIALLNFVSSRLFFLLGLEHLPVVTHAYIVNFTGVATMFLSILILNQHPTSMQWIGAAIALFGLHIYFSQNGQDASLLGIFYTVMVVVSLALTNNLVRRFLQDSKNLDAGDLSLLTGAIGGSCWLIMGVGETLAYNANNLPTGIIDWATILANGFFIICLGLTVFNYVLGKLPSYEVSLLASSGVIFSAFFSWMILSESLTWHQVTGILILLLGLVLVQTQSPLRSKLNQ